MKATIRKMREEEYRMLGNFLYEAIYVPEGMEPPPRGIIACAELQVYVAGFGSQPHDCCFVAECGGRVIGAAWARIMDDYGHVDGETPSCAISLYREYRGRGIGSALMVRLLECLRERGYRQVSLSVQKADAAVRFYERLGFEPVRETAQEYIMLRRVGEECGQGVGVHALIPGA